MTKKKALATIEERVGKQFSPELTPLFLGIVNKMG
jgi:response regulator RpfG family c-di-GMP phosphodiesterase